MAHSPLDFGDISRLPRGLRSRALTAENPTGAPGAGGQAAGGRKGSAFLLIPAGDEAVIADIDGPATVRHIWLTFPPGPPAEMRSVLMEAYYDRLDEPSIAVPITDFFCMPHGRPVALDSALISVHEGRGFNSYLPMPFRSHLRLIVRNQSEGTLMLFYQLDLTENELDDSSTYLHASFRRDNPTTLRRDFVIEDGLRGPGRFVGMSVGFRRLGPQSWYGEGEVKMFIDGDDELSTICGTGLEDYVGSAWGLSAYQAHMAGSPLCLVPPGAGGPEFASFYRWHLPDPIVFEDRIRVTIQQIGSQFFAEQEEFERFKAQHEPAAFGWLDLPVIPGTVGGGLYERVDDYCAVSYTYCARPQAVPRVDLDSTLADIELRPYEIG